MASLHRDAARVLDAVFARKGTVKGLVLGGKYANKKALYAIVCETLKYKDALEEIIQRSQLLQNVKKLPKTMALVLVFDLLFSRGGLRKTSCPHTRAVLNQKTRLKAELARLKIRRGITRNKELIPESVRQLVALPRYVRVNLLRTTVDKVLRHFAKDGYALCSHAAARAKTICRDRHLSDLLVLPPNTDLHAHPLYLSGDIILQDKASCFPAHVLAPPPGAMALDGCAAPGNKTSHLASLMGNQGRIWAFDLDARRLELLQRMTSKANCQIITPVHQSFLEIDPTAKDYARVEYILLDPSCSGSGIVSRLDQLVEQAEQDDDAGKETASSDRLEQLARFQLECIQHAFKFPSVKRISYSTCSIHRQENEEVVREALLSTDQFELAPRSHVLPDWTHRGEAIEDQADALIRASPASDHTNGFFVACFQRRSTAK
ncbi:S-adenosyl-L-methionine-dependent methyltransferase [Syncephalis pseudoplumigaleata]|uniref:S-adenosyl-L-methionine-dependent methyltransferase n=1 Tax=Syncephalis pseudoplumigaleata TaxID=1712513 RepID=A0A4P9YZS3_9FUNG|nr:S-adenosyl-L-methionine-dependent methyltransferase [Syncephalis pseudoplumigaleata]|eukprot:RKP25465.1 S-adenosyl-L-methionine-dependent methyltransferase [Syncephalis pseudoplumigaleata]